MPKRRQTPDRPRDGNQLAKLIVDISTGEAEDEMPPTPDPAATKRGEARAAKLPPERRSEIAKTAARTRWPKEG